MDLNCTLKLNIKKLCRNGFKRLYCVREQGVIRFNSGAYKLVRGHFESYYNTALRQNIEIIIHLNFARVGGFHMQDV